MQREKIRGGQVKVPIHASNVKITTLNLQDKRRSNKLQGGGKSEAAEKKEEKVEKETTKKVAKKEEADE
jgi:large subunit ribosomal protein L24